MGQLDGLKTYLAAIGLGVLGLVFLLASPEATWSNPQGSYEAAVSRVVGWLSLLLAVVVASLRHAIHKLEVSHNAHQNQKDQDQN